MVSLQALYINLGGGGGGRGVMFWVQVDFLALESTELQETTV